MFMSDIVGLLVNDLKNEWKHLRFYAYHAGALTGLHAHEYKELFKEQAQSELEHVGQFCDLIIGLGGQPTTESNDFPVFTKVEDAIAYAIEMEAEVVGNYVERIAQLDTVPIATIRDSASADLKWIEIFLEKQIEDSRQDLDHFKQLLK
jgi:bacterioferritin (cytochrome b1)